MTYSPSVEQWRPLVQQYFAPQDVEKALYVIEHESGGNPSIYGDGGHSVGLFQLNDQGLASGRSLQALQDPAANMQVAAEAVYGGQGWGPWGENNLYNGQPFGALGANPYSGGRFGAPAMPTNEPKNGDRVELSDGAYMIYNATLGRYAVYEIDPIFGKPKLTGWQTPSEATRTPTTQAGKPTAQQLLEKGAKEIAPGVYELDLGDGRRIQYEADPLDPNRFNPGTPFKYGGNTQNRLSSSALGRVDPLKGKETNRASAALFEKGPFSAYAPENYGSASTPGSLAYDIKNQGPAAAFKFGAPNVGFDVAGQDAVLGPFGGVGSGGISGDINITGARTATIGGGLDDSAGFGFDARATLQAYGADVTGDPFIDDANAANLIATRDNYIQQGYSPAQAQQIIMMKDEPYVPNPYEAQSFGQSTVSGKGTTGVPEGGILGAGAATGQTFAHGGQFTSVDPIEMRNLRTKERVGVFAENGPETATFTPRNDYANQVRTYAQGIRGSMPDSRDPLALRAWARSVRAGFPVRPIRPAPPPRPIAPPSRVDIDDTLYSRDGVPGFQTGGSLTSDESGVTMAPLTYDDRVRAAPVAPVSYADYINALAPATQGEYLDARDRFRHLANQTDNRTLLAAPVTFGAGALARNAAIAALDPQMRNAPPLAPAPITTPTPVITPVTPGAEVNDAVRLAWEARQRAYDAPKLAAAGLPPYMGVDLPLGANPELPPGLYNRQPDMSGAIIELQNQLLGATDPEVRKRIQETIDQLRGYLSGGSATPIEGGGLEGTPPTTPPSTGGLTPEAIQAWMATRPTSGDVNAWRTWLAAIPGGARIPRIGDQVEGTDPLAILAARKFGDRAA